MVANIFLQIGIWEYVLYAIGIVVVMRILSRLLPIASVFINIAIVIAAVYLAFKHTHWLTAAIATGILLVFLIISWVVKAMSEPSGPSFSVRYRGRGADGKPVYDITQHGGNADG